MEVQIAPSFLKSLKKMNSFWTRVKHNYYDLYYGIRNLIKWFSIIWETREWDGEYTYIILRHKCKLQREMFEDVLKRGWYGEHTPEYIEQIKECESILSRLIEDDYNIPEYKEYIEKKYTNFSDMFEEADENGMRRMKSATDEERELMFRNNEYEKTMKEKDKKRLYELLSENLEKWWD